MSVRQVVLDTETTGLDPKKGHRIIEIGCVEIIDRKITDIFYHQYIDPQREIDPGALAVHGITNQFLQGKPIFKEISQQFLSFIRNAQLIIHNATFDVGFIDNELAMCNNKFGLTSDYCSVIDTLPLARKRHPGQKNNLDALCKRYGIDNSDRDLHGALLDAKLLALVYLAMTGGQSSLFDEEEDQPLSTTLEKSTILVSSTLTFDKPGIVINATVEELELHQQKLNEIDKKSGGQCLWKKHENESL